MAGRVLDRRRLRAPGEAVTPAALDVADGAAPPRKRKAKVAGEVKVRKPRAKKAPARICARWGVFDGGMKRVAIFDYNERAAANDKLVDLRAKSKGVFFLQIVKESMAEVAEATPSPE